MTATPKTTVAEENTQRLIARANRLGYIIVMIDTTEKLAIEIRPSTLDLYTPPVAQDWTTGEWTIQTTAYGALDLAEIEKVTDGYGRAVAMVSELEHLTAADVVNYSVAR